MELRDQNSGLSEIENNLRRETATVTGMASGIGAVTSCGAACSGIKKMMELMQISSEKPKGGGAIEV